MAASANPRARLEHILFHIRGVAETIRGVDAATFAGTYYLERTVERALQIISEAVRTLPAELLANYPEIEWPKIAAIGNVLRHEYQRIDPASLWDVATVKLPELSVVVQRILRDIDR